MKQLFIIFLVVITLNGFTQKTNQFNSKGEKDGEWREIRHSNTFFEYKNIHKGSYENGLKTGEWIEYSVDSSKIRAKLNYKKDTLVGENLYYHMTGELYKKVIYDTVNKFNYYLTSFYPNGQIETVGNYFGNFKVGEWFSYSLNGQLVSKIVYINGKPDGEVVIYHDNGNFFSKANYSDGKPVGEVLTYYINGKLKSKENYKDDKRNGKCEYFTEKGKLIKTETYKDGELVK